MLMDPLAPAIKPLSPSNMNASRMVSPHYGYNYIAFAPLTYTTKWINAPISMTGLADPAGTVMLAARTSNAEIPSWLTFWNFGGDTSMEHYHVFPPVFGPLYKGLDWGRGGDTDAPYINSGVPAGAVSGYTSFRGAETGVVTWGDSHASKPKIGALAAGTNFQNVSTWRYNQTQVTDKTKYLWDNE